MEKYLVFNPVLYSGPVDIVVATYNNVPGVTCGDVIIISGVKILFITEIFHGDKQEKSPENITPSNERFVLLEKVTMQSLPKKIIIFAGLVFPSGSDRIIELFCSTFRESLDILDFGFCDCNREIKVNLARSLGIKDSQMWGFWDNNPRCVDWGPLYGRVIQWALCLSSPELFNKVWDNSRPKSFFLNPKSAQE